MAARLPSRALSRPQAQLPGEQRLTHPSQHTGSRRCSFHPARVASANGRTPRGSQGLGCAQTAVVEQHGKSAAGSLAPIGAARVDVLAVLSIALIRLAIACAHASLLNEDRASHPRSREASSWLKRAQTTNFVCDRRHTIRQQLAIAKPKRADPNAEVLPLRDQC
jgi:hypothetical protein